ncbi:MAG: glycosyltransferase [Saprospiraceae bacterium]|nr:glycosyltransferase [Saprospiraceae bacterium]
MLLKSNINKQVSVKNQFIFIASDFKGKGGELIVKAFSLFQKNNLAYSLLIVGQKPPSKFIKIPNVIYLGYIDKSSPKGLENLNQLFQESKSMILLTRKDILPLTIIEGGLLGCPTIANPLNAIPEAIEHLKTGWLIESNINKLVETFKYIANMNSSQYNLIRQSVIKKMDEEYNWDSILINILTGINN